MPLNQPLCLGQDAKISESSSPTPAVTPLTPWGSSVSDWLGLKGVGQNARCINKILREKWFLPQVFIKADDLKFKARRIRKTICLRKKYIFFQTNYNLRAASVQDAVAVF